MKTPTLLATAFAVALTSFAISTDAGAARSLTVGRNATAAATVAKPARKSAAAAKAAKSEEPCPYLFGCPAKAKAAAGAKTSKSAHVAKKATKSRSVKKKGRHTAAARASTVDPVRTGSIAPSTSTGAGPYGAIIARYAASYGVPVSLAKAVISIESNYRPHMTGSAGEVGLMQIKPATARMLGYTGSVKGLYDPETNIRFGMKYLAMAHDLGGGTTCGTILKYNAGHAATRMNPISSAYCRKVKVQMASAGSPA
ncbi:transglycosylase SLT domain-containing protein [Mesorhizobium sp. 8]|uniref:lytic transglycosylase domain-containing protein n=1 Tax=Mesorhizobium sp. 8 TaxID=2584466 RepID=UPI001123AC4E|nr:transglycosylase SLT domain-containing protein [Mesorhizobium sp. 8]QDC00069.1 lytic transglycosylase domain-containing protein [Mesorhizobium sp. 8]